MQNRTAYSQTSVTQRRRKLDEADEARIIEREFNKTPDPKRIFKQK